MIETVVNIEECLIRLSDIASQIENLQQSNKPIAASEVMAQLTRVIEIIRKIHRPVGLEIC